ncbi:MAG: hypothetical protein J0I12_15310 [Candidatus Eremiobacteraeota bacterium]|nr:hypothetical protein [Candidatus Eremiobacteraeota bacterium]
MRLRLQLLALIGVLLSLALATSFALIFRAVRNQALADLDRSLEAGHHVWDSLSRARAENLATTTSGTAAEAGFLRILRGTDAATLLDDLHQRQKNNASLDLLAVYDDQGHLRLATQAGLPTTPDALVESALDGQVGASFWRGPDGLYIAGVAPIQRQGGITEGVLLLATRLDAEYLKDLARDTNLQVAVEETAPVPTNRHQRTYPVPDYTGQSLGTLVLGRDLDVALAYMDSVRGQLWWLGAGAVALAFLFSIPLVGRMTNPVLQLEKAQAEMDAVFQANLDGLVALDQAGRVVNANPAAGVCLGLAAEKLPGTFLQQILPQEVFAQLVAASPHDGQLVQRCLYRREGHTFQLTRTFVASRHREVGSILLTREIGESARNPLELLDDARPVNEDDWIRFERNRANFLWLSGRRSAPEPGNWESELTRLGVPLSLPGLSLEREPLRLLLLNLWPCHHLLLEPEAGGSWLSVRNPDPPGAWEREVLLGLLEELQGRFFEEGGQLRIWLPRS